MTKDQQEAKKLDYELKIIDEKIIVCSKSYHTDVFIKIAWTKVMKQLLNQNQWDFIGQNFILLKQQYGSLKQFQFLIDECLKNVCYSQSQLYLKNIQEIFHQDFNTRILNPLTQSQFKNDKFILCYEFQQISKPNQDQSCLNTLKGKAYSHQKQNQWSLKYSKAVFFIYYFKKDYSKVKEFLTNLQRIREEWVLYPLNEYLDCFLLQKIYQEEIIGKMIKKCSGQIIKIIQNLCLELVDEEITVFNDQSIYWNCDWCENIQLEKGVYLRFHLFGNSQQYFQFYQQINQFFENKRLWILRPSKICCCQIVDLEGFLMQKQNLEAYLISKYIVVIVKSRQEVNRLTSLKQAQKICKNSIIFEKNRLTKLLQTGQFVLNARDYDKEDFEYILNEKQRYKKYLWQQRRVQVEYLAGCTRKRLRIFCEFSAFLVFKQDIYLFRSQYKLQKEQLKQFNTPFQLYRFQTYFEQQLKKQFLEIKFAIKSKNQKKTVWAKFYTKNRLSFLERLNQITKSLQFDLDYLVCRAQPIAQNWFEVYKRPHLLSIHTLTCRKYLISRETKVYIKPYQSLSRPVEEMLFLIDQSFENCCQFLQIAQQNNVNIMSLFLEFQQKKKKNPGRIKCIPLTNHRYISKMLIWYNDMLRKIESRKQQDIKNLYLRYEKKKQMHIMIPRHAATSILLHFVLPSFIKQFTQQTGYSLKQINFYYSILFDGQHQFVQDLTLKVIDDQMKKVEIQLQNQNYLTKDSIKKVQMMEYLSLYCTAQANQQVSKASNLSSYVFFIERERLLLKEKCLRTNLQKINIALNVKIPLFFKDASFNREIIVDLQEEEFFEVGKVTVEGPFILKSDSKYDEILKCIWCIKDVFRNLTYVVLYIDQNFIVGKNGYYYSHKQHTFGLNNTSPKTAKPNYTGKCIKPRPEVTFQALQPEKSLFFMQKQKSINPNNTVQKLNRIKAILNPIRLELHSNQNRQNRSNNAKWGKIIRRDANKLNIEVVESQITDWFMVETCQSKFSQLQNYINNPKNFKNYENFLSREISELSILDLSEENQNSIFIDSRLLKLSTERLQERSK